MENPQAPFPDADLGYVVRIIGDAPSHEISKKVPRDTFDGGAQRFTALLPVDTVKVKRKEVHYLGIQEAMQLLKRTLGKDAHGGLEVGHILRQESGLVLDLCHLLGNELQCHCGGANR